MKKFLLLSILLPIVAVITFTLVIGYFYWYVPFWQDQALREEWRKEEETAKQLEILEEQEKRLKLAETRREKFEALAGIGFSRYGLKDFEGAVKYWQKSLDLEPTHSLTWYNLGTAYRNLENFAETEKCYKKAINTSSGVEPLFYNALARLYWFNIPEKRGDVPSVYTFGLLKEPKNIELLKGMTWYYENVGNKEMAFKYYEKILEIDPSFEVPK